MVHDELLADGESAKLVTRGAALERQGKFDDALACLNSALRKNRRAYAGNDHPDTARIHRAIASVYESKGQYDQAQVELEAALTILRNVHSDDAHPDIKEVRTSLGMLYRLLGQYSNAFAEFDAVLRVLDNDDPGLPRRPEDRLLRTHG